jgi:hypothetical protein
MIDRIFKLGYTHFGLPRWSDDYPSHRYPAIFGFHSLGENFRSGFGIVEKIVNFKAGVIDTWDRTNLRIRPISMDQIASSSSDTCK